MTKLNIFQVNGVWQLGRPHQANEEDDEEDQLPQEDVQGGQPWSTQVRNSQANRNVSPNMGGDARHTTK